MTPLSYALVRRWLRAIAALGTLVAGACQKPSAAPPADEHEHEHAGHDHDHDHDHDDEHHEETTPAHEQDEETITLSEEAIQRYGVRIERATRQDLHATITAPARVVFNGEAIAHVGTPLPGRVVEPPAPLGAEVVAGEVLTVIESPELGEAQGELLTRRIAVQGASAAAELASSALERARGLFEASRGIALDEVQRREVEYRAARAALETAQSAELAAENKLRLLGVNDDALRALRESSRISPRLSLRSPIAGRVVERHATLGELVQPEQESLFIVADMRTLWVLADVSEQRLSGVVVGARARIHVNAEDGHSHEGVVSSISPVINPRTRAAEVRIEARCEHGGLWPGMFVRVELEMRTAAGAPQIAVASSAIHRIDQAPSVFVALAGGHQFARRVVRVGAPIGAMVPVLEGLSEGEAFVADGGFILKAELGKASAEHQH